MATITVHVDRHGALVAAGLGVELLGLGGIEGAVLATGVGLVAVHHRGDPAGSRSPGASEDLLGDQRAIEAHRNGVTHLGVLEVVVLRGEGQHLDDAGVADTVAVREVGLPGVVDQLVGRDHIGDIKVVGHNVVVGGVGVVVDAEGDLVHRTGVLAGVVSELVQDHLGVGLRGQLVGAGADRCIAESLLALGGVSEESVRLRHERGVAQTNLEVRGRRAGGDGEGVVINNLQTAHGLSLRRLVLAVGFASGGHAALQVGVAGDGLEEVGVQLAVRTVGAPVPGVNEVLGLHFGAVGELVALVQRHGEVGCVSGLDRLRDIELRGRGIGVVVDQLGGDGVQDIATTDLIG